jgi:formiminotetrahydrofolate cyclodeaminase
MVKDLEAWLDDLSAKPLPGGVAAAAVAAAMGAALMAKAARVTLKQQRRPAAGAAALESALGLARARRMELVELAAADERAYRGVLEPSTAADEAWRPATELPICVAEACRSLLDRMPALLDLCWPAVRTDLEIGAWLLEVGVRAGLAAAESNLSAWSPGSKADALWTRIRILQEGSLD